VSRRQKQLDRLAALEADLRQRLISEIEAVASGRNTNFFCVPEFNPHGLPAHMLSAKAEELSTLALQALQLRETLHEPVENSVGHLFRQALREANDLTNHDRLGPIRHAQVLLDLFRTSLPG
jgi:hypothetical protein